jgi:hypothetical protein
MGVASMFLKAKEATAPSADQGPKMNVSYIRNSYACLLISLLLVACATNTKPSEKKGDTWVPPEPTVDMSGMSFAGEASVRGAPRDIKFYDVIAGKGWKRSPGEPDPSYGFKSAHIVLSRYVTNRSMLIDGRDVAANTTLYGVKRHKFWWIEPKYVDIRVLRSDIAFVRKPGDKMLTQLTLSPNGVIDEKLTQFPDYVLPKESTHSNTALDTLITVTSSSAVSDLILVDHEGKPGAPIPQADVNSVVVVGNNFLIRHPGNGSPKYAVYNAAGERLSPFFTQYLKKSWSKKINSYSSLYSFDVLFPVEGEPDLYWPLAKGGKYISRPDQCMGVKEMVGGGNYSGIYAVKWLGENNQAAWAMVQDKFDEVTPLVESGGRAIWSEVLIKQYNFFAGEKPFATDKGNWFYIVKDFSTSEHNAQWHVYGDISTTKRLPVGPFTTSAEASKVMIEIQDKLIAERKMEQMRAASDAAQYRQRMAEEQAASIAKAQKEEAERRAREAELEAKYGDIWRQNAAAAKAWENLAYPSSTSQSSSYDARERHLKAIKETQRRQNEQHRRMGLQEMYNVD